MIHFMMGVLWLRGMHKSQINALVNVHFMITLLKLIGPLTVLWHQSDTF